MRDIEQAGPELARFGIELNINQTDIAAMVNSSRAKVNGALAKLDAAGELSASFRRIGLNASAFEAV
jgi:CRP-like cAMP-binding protein